MRIDKLISRLPDTSIGRTHLFDPAADVYTVSFLTIGGGGPRSDVLYFGDTTLLPKDLPENSTFNCVLFGSDTEQAPLAHPQANFVELAADADPFACYNALQTFFLEDQTQTDIVRRMLVAHFSNKGLQYLIEEAASALGNPIVVVDPTYRYIAYHLGDLEGCSSHVAQVISAEIQNETVMEEAIAYIHREGIDEQIARASGPLVRMNSLLQTNTMTSAVMVGGVCVAHVMMMEHARPFSELDAICFDRLADFVGQEMQKSEVWSHTAGELGAFFLANLLADRSPSEAVTLRRLKAVNFHPKGYLQVICLHAPGEGLSQLQVEHIAGQLRPLLHHSLYTRFHHQLVVLASREEKRGIGDYAERLLSEVSVLNELTCGISNTFTHITQVRAGYDQARRAIRYGERSQKVRHGRPIYRYCDYAYVHALDLFDRRTNLLMLCPPELMDLYAYDEQRGGELMETLFCYLQVAGSTTHAAKLLNLHKNTLLYRINRIKEILDCDLTSGEELFKLQIGFRALLYLGLFTPRVTLEEDA